MSSINSNSFCKIHGCISQLTYPTMSLSNLAENDKDRSIEVVKVAGSNKVDVTTTEYSTLMVTTMLSIICCYRNFEMIKKLMNKLTTQAPPLHVTDYKSSRLYNQYIMKGTFVHGCMEASDGHSNCYFLFLP